MAFMVIRGKAYHCNSCEKEVKVEYEGGAQLTQIGDEYVKIQKELNSKYNPKGYNGEGEGYYFHIEGLICQDCFDENHRISGDINLLQENSPMDDISDIIDLYKDNLDNLIEDILPDILMDIDLKDLRYLNEKKYDNMVNSDFFKVLAKREQFIEDFVFEYSDQINEFIMEKIREHEEVLELNHKYREETGKIKNFLLELNDKVSKGFFQERDVNEVDILNPYLANDNTTRYPVKSELEYKFYSGPYELSMTNLDELTKDANVLDLLEQSEIYFGYEIDKLKERLKEELG